MQYEQHRLAEEETLKANTPVYPDDLFYMKQTINNACGTCALIHAVSNNKQLSSHILRRRIDFHNFCPSTQDRSEGWNPEKISEFSS